MREKEGNMNAEDIDVQSMFKPGMVVDAVNHPPHYMVGGIETIDYMKAKSTKEEFLGHLRLTAIKYLSRVGHKGDALEDYKKAQWYLNRLVKEIEEDHGNR